MAWLSLVQTLPPHMYILKTWKVQQYIHVYHKLQYTTVTVIKAWFTARLELCCAIKRCKSRLNFYIHVACTVTFWVWCKAILALCCEPGLNHSLVYAPHHKHGRNSSCLLPLVSIAMDHGKCHLKREIKVQIQVHVCEHQSLLVLIVHRIHKNRYRRH